MYFLGLAGDGAPVDTAFWHLFKSLPADWAGHRARVRLAASGLFPPEEITKNVSRQDYVSGFQARPAIHPDWPLTRPAAPNTV